MKPPDPVLTQKLVEIALHFGINYSELINHSRKRNLVKIRFAIFEVLRETMTLEAIGSIFNRNHSSIFYGRQESNTKRDYEKEAESIYQKVREILNGH
jgi:chromosomal replication initiation ATPase DnaA